MKIAPIVYLPEYIDKENFVPNVTINSAIDTLQDFKDDSAFIFSGSWVRGYGYDPRLSDHDLTTITKDESYSAMEKKIYDMKECLDINVIKRLKKHKIPEKKIYYLIRPSIKDYPTPRVQNCFDSYSQFRKYTNLNINLNKYVEDTDKGLWQMKGLMTSHFENEGQLIYFDKKNQLINFKIKDNKKLFYSFVKEKDIYIAPKEPLFFSQKISILNEFIDTLKENKNISPRTYFKYLQRIQKFFFKDSQNDLFNVSDDVNKMNKPKFKKMIENEKLFYSTYNNLMDDFTKSSLSDRDCINDNIVKNSLEKLLRFKELSFEMLKRPVLRGFKI